MTYTYATLKISQKAYEEIYSKLIKAGYKSNIEDEVINMKGIALVKETEINPPY